MALDNTDEALRLLRKKRAADNPSLDTAIARLLNVRTFIAAIMAANGDKAKIKEAERAFIQNRPPRPKKRRSIWSRFFRRDSR